MAGPEQKFLVPLILRNNILRHEADAKVKPTRRPQNRCGPSRQRMEESDLRSKSLTVSGRSERPLSPITRGGLAPSNRNCDLLLTQSVDKHFVCCATLIQERQVERISMSSQGSSIILYALMRKGFLACCVMTKGVRVSIYNEGPGGAEACPYCGSTDMGIRDESTDECSYSITYECSGCGALGCELYEVVGTTWHKGHGASNNGIEETEADPEEELHMPTLEELYDILMREELDMFRREDPTCANASMGAETSTIGRGRMEEHVREKPSRMPHHHSSDGQATTQPSTLTSSVPRSTTKGPAVKPGSGLKPGSARLEGRRPGAPPRPPGNGPFRTSRPPGPLKGSRP